MSVAPIPYYIYTIGYSVARVWIRLYINNLFYYTDYDLFKRSRQHVRCRKGS